LGLAVDNTPAPQQAMRRVVDSRAAPGGQPVLMVSAVAFGGLDSVRMTRRWFVPTYQPELHAAAAELLTAAAR
jgi:hypothetical protein